MEESKTLSGLVKICISSLVICGVILIVHGLFTDPAGTLGFCLAVGIIVPLLVLFGAFLYDVMEP